MSFYGNISNAGRTNLTFDRIYPNRESMERNCQNDGVFVGRHVLIEYDDNTTARRRGYLTEDVKGNLYQGIIQQPLVIYQDDTCEHPYVYKSEENKGLYGLEQGDIVEVILPYEDLNEQVFYVHYYFVCGMTVKNEDGIETIYPEINGFAAFDFLEVSISDRTDYSLNYIIDKNWSLVNGYDKEFEDSQTWDSTIWQKAVVNGQYVYKMIGSLNSKSPIFSIEPDAPSINPIAPHFGQDSTNQNYVLHIQPNWGLKVKKAENEKYSDQKVEYKNQKYNPDAVNADGTTGRMEYDDSEEAPINEEYAGAIYFNRAGFVSRYRNKELELPTEVSILPTGISGRPYINHVDDETLSEEDMITEGETVLQQPDIQEITMHLPAIGNAISDLWDLMYGEYEYDKNGNLVYETDSDGNLIYELDGNGDYLLDDGGQKIPIIKYKDKRNLDVEWNSLEGTRMITEGASGFDYNQDKVHTVAGAINSVHDLMGMIINEAKTDENGNNTTTLKDAYLDYIYYGPMKNKEDNGFFIKSPICTYVPYVPESEGDLDAFYKEFYYPDLTQYIPGKYHIKLNQSYYIELSDNPTSNINYYLIDTEDGSKAIPINLKQWTPVELPEEDEEEGGEDTETPIFPDFEDTILNHYYNNDNGDYIRDLALTPHPDRLYYTIIPTQKTWPKSESYEEHVELYKPVQREAYESFGATYYRGYIYFLYTLDENGNKVYGDQAFELVPQKIDENGNLIFEQKVDKEGNLVYEPLYDEEGNIIVDEEGNVQYDKSKPVWDLDKPIFDEAPDFISNATYFYVDKYKIAYGTSTTDGLTLILQNDAGQNYNASNMPSEDCIVEFQPIKDKDGNDISYYTYEGFDFIKLQDNNEADNTKVYYTIEATPENGTNVPVIKEDVEDSISEGDAEGSTEEEENNNSSNEEDTSDIVETQEVYYYVKDKYYYQPQDTQNYLFGKETNMVKDVQYFILPENIDAEDITFYEAGKYYYQKEVDGEKIEELDFDTTMKTADTVLEDGTIVANEDGRVYYLRNELYVIEDTSGILAQGSVWNSGWPVPNTITLGKLYQGEEVIKEFDENGTLVDKTLTPDEQIERLFEWKQLTGFARTLNTINGLILKINQFFKFDDKLTRDRSTIQGSLNCISDLINDFGKLIPGEIAVIDEYGRVKSAELFTTEEDGTDGWISVSVDDSATDTKITFRHEDPKSAEVDKETAVEATQEPKFGDTFDIINGLAFDDKGHAYLDNCTTSTVKIPKGELNQKESTDNAKVLTEIEFTPETGAIEVQYQDVGTLKLTGYEEVAALGLTGGQANITAENTLNEAINKLDQFTANEAKALDQEIERAKKAESDLNAKIDLVFDDKDISDLDSVVDLINWTTEHGETVEEILSSIAANKAAIESNDTDISNLQANLTKTKSTLTESINTNKTSIEANDVEILDLQVKVGTESVAKQIGDAIAAQNLDQYATSIELNALDERVVNLENNTYQSQIDTLNVTIEALQNTIKDLITRIEVLEELNNSTPSDPTE